MAYMGKEYKIRVDVCVCITDSQTPVALDFATFSSYGVG